MDDKDFNQVNNDIGQNDDPVDALFDTDNFDTKKDEEEKKTLYFENIDPESFHVEEVQENHQYINSSYGVVCLVCGILGVLTSSISFIPSFFFGIITAIILIIDRKLSKRFNPLTVAGFACGMVAVFIGIVQVFLLIFVIEPYLAANQAATTTAFVNLIFR